MYFAYFSYVFVSVCCICFLLMYFNCFLYLVFFCLCIQLCFVLYYFLCRELVEEINKINIEHHDRLIIKEHFTIVIDTRIKQFEDVHNHNHQMLSDDYWKTSIKHSDLFTASHRLSSVYLTASLQFRQQKLLL